MVGCFSQQPKVAGRLTKGGLESAIEIALIGKPDLVRHFRDGKGTFFQEPHGTREANMCQIADKARSGNFLKQPDELGHAHLGQSRGLL